MLSCTKDNAMNDASPIQTQAVKPLPIGAAPMLGKIGVLLVNLGTPDATDAAVGAPLSAASSSPTSG